MSWRDLEGSLLFSAPTVTTHFSGIGTAEVALQCLVTASYFLKRRLSYLLLAACDNHSGRRRVLRQALPSITCVFQDILGRSGAAQSMWRQLVLL